VSLHNTDGELRHGDRLLHRTGLSQTSVLVVPHERARSSLINSD
jgi:hypothetical protein